MGACFSCNYIEENSFADKNIHNTKIFNLVDKEILAKVVDIYDGDTCTCIFNIFGDYYKFKIRLAEIDTCEMTSSNEKLKQKAIEAKMRLYNLITNKTILGDKGEQENKDISKKAMKEILNKENYIVKILCGDFDKYGRVLGWLYTKDSVINKYDKSNSFNHILIKEKLAYLYYGNAKSTEEDQIKSLL